MFSANATTPGAAATATEGQKQGGIQTTPAIVTRRTRRTKAEMQAFREALLEIVAESYPCTVRQTFYQALRFALVEKLEKNYKSIGRLLGEMRMDGTIPWEWIVDPTRGRNRPTTFNGPPEALAVLADVYRRPLWNDTPATCQIWLEKLALEGIVETVTRELDVPLYTTRGFGSKKQIRDAAMEIAADPRPCHVYTFGDYDPSGECISEVIERDLRDFAPHSEIHFTRMAVTPAQIEEFDLPLRPTKKSDPRAKNWIGGSVELDAIPANDLRAMVRKVIMRHTSPEIISEIHREEEMDLRWLADLAARYERGAE